MKTELEKKYEELNDCRKGLINILEKRITDGELTSSVLRMAEEFRKSIERLESEIADLKQQEEDKSFDEQNNLDSYYNDRYQRGQQQGEKDVTDIKKAFRITGKEYY